MPFLGHPVGLDTLRDHGKQRDFQDYSKGAKYVAGGSGRFKGRPPPLLAQIFLSQKAAFFRVKAYRSLCAFAINECGG